VKPPFDYFDSKGDRITVARYTAPPNYSELVAQTMYDGVELPNVAHEFKNDPRHDGRFTQPYGERNAIGYMLVTAGLYKSNLRSENPPLPDIRAELADGTTVYIETAEVIELPSARLEGVFQFVNVGIANYVHVTTSGSFSAMFQYPLLPPTFTVSATAIMRVRQ